MPRARTRRGSRWKVSSPFGPIQAGLVDLVGPPWKALPMSTQSSLSVAVPQRTWRLIEAHLQTARARVIEAEVLFDDHSARQTPTPHRDDLWEALGIADSTLQAVLALIREVPQTPMS